MFTQTNLYTIIEIQRLTMFDHRMQMRTGSYTAERNGLQRYTLTKIELYSRLYCHMHIHILYTDFILTDTID